MTRLLFKLLLAGAAVSAHVLKRDGFTDCLNAADADIVTASDSRYPAAIEPFNHRLETNPAAVAYPNTQHAVGDLVKCAAQSGVSVVARSGGHSYAAFGLGGYDGALVVDLSQLKKLTVDDDGIAHAQTGLLLGELAQGIYDIAGVALPHGTCPYVGTGGQASFGGFGFLSRREGLLLDRIVAAQVILANGTLVRVTKDDYPDIFWAVRGAAPSFGIVTTWNFATVPAPASNIVFHITLPETSSQSQISKALADFHAWGVTAPEQLGINAVLYPNDDKTNVLLEFQGTYYGSTKYLNEAIQTFVDKLPAGTSFTKTKLGWIDGLEALDGSLDTSAPEGHDTFFAKSYAAKSAIPAASWDKFVAYLFNQGLKTPLNWFVEADLWGGAISRGDKATSSFAIRDAQVVFQLYASSKDYERPYPKNGTAFIINMLAALVEKVESAYANYVDPTLLAPDWHQQYYGSNYNRLVAIKKAVDPNNVFNFPQVIGNDGI